MQDSKKMTKVFDLSVQEIEKVLSGKSAITDITKVASAAMATYSRVKSTEVHELALQIMMDRQGIRMKELEV